ncbi:methyltransferase domain-containing protein [Kordiimonas aestuarii]|uniref:methyltransferase domain-containing protein n=1 Tax=Kordiimonas aestuarii TaxID=1005925 RepID=UPI0021CF2288|nr:methyltransferase domain-containing protein [Kordiimonas aestuarii]
MTSPQKPDALFDMDAVLRNAARGRAMGTEFDFLREEVADRMQDRLKDINRRFENVLDIGGRSFVNEATTVHLPAGDAALDATPSSHDLVISNLSMHWVNDLPGLMVQANHALKPDGLFIASLFGGDTLHELRHALIAAESEVVGGASARIIPFADVRDLGSLLQRAGFALPVTDMDTITVTYEHPLKLMQELRGMGEANAMTTRSRTFLRRDVLARACEIYTAKYAGPDGRIPATFQVMYMTGWHPHESQQKPLKPGSGKVNLADALKADRPPKKPE